MPYPKGAHLKSPVVKPSCRPQLIELLTEKPMTCKQLAKIVERAPDVVNKNLRAMTGKAYIAEWKGPEAVWALGDKPHAPRVIVHSTKSKAVMARKRIRSEQDYLNSQYIKGERIWGI